MTTLFRAQGYVDGPNRKRNRPVEMIDIIVRRMEDHWEVWNWGFERWEECEEEKR